MYTVDTLENYNVSTRSSYGRHARGSTEVDVVVWGSHEPGTVVGLALELSTAHGAG